jgi:hypothetical protein
MLNQHTSTSAFIRYAIDQELAHLCMAALITPYPFTAAARALGVASVIPTV